jgi:pimeloyl-ACP methyl ester carboxylesterase
VWFSLRQIIQLEHAMVNITHIEQNGLTLAVRKVGESDRACLVLLHGWPQTGLAWEGVLPELGRDHYALAFDLPGIGDSHGVPGAQKTKPLQCGFASEGV